MNMVYKIKSNVMGVQCTCTHNIHLQLPINFNVKAAALELVN